MKYLPSILFFVLSLSLQASAQELEITETNSDIILQRAQASYQSGNFRESLQLTQRGLELSPEYHDIRILQIRNLWALNNHEAADKELFHLLSEAPGYVGIKPLALQRLGHFEQNQEALRFMERLEQVYAGEPDLQVQKAQLLLDVGQREEARRIANKELNRPSISGAQRYTLQIILNRTVTDEVGLTYQYMHFSDEYPRNDPWNSITGEYQHNFNRTAVIGRVLYTDRSYAEGTMYELEAYPVFNDRWYAYTNVGFSNSEIFPDFRTSASIYHNFAAVFEAEAGGRLLHLPNTDFFTGILGLSLYEGKFLFNVRTFLGPKRIQKLVQNYQANVRYYMGNPDNYLFLRAGTGISPDEQNRAQEAQLQPELKAFYTNLGIRQLFLNHHILQVEVGMLHEEINSRVSGNQLTATVGYRFRF